MNADATRPRPGFRPLALGDPIPVPREVTPETERAVRRAAAELVRQAADRIPGWSSPPFDPGVLARALGVPVHFAPGLEGIDALIVRRGGRFHILVRSDVTNAGRLNFTLAHELGHLFFAAVERRVHHRARDRKRYDLTPEGRAHERMCDLAAAELLMPSPWFDASASEYGFNAAAVPRLAERFQVSLEASALRLLSTKRDEPCAIGFFEYGVRPSARRRDGSSDPEAPEVTKYRVRRVFRTRSFPYLFPEGKSVPSESVVYRSSLGREMLEAKERFSLGRAEGLLEVSACPLGRDEAIEEPPMVCAVFRPARG